jgi:hypothetical protein
LFAYRPKTAPPQGFSLASMPYENPS